jgi:peptidoglycan/LPS O-acetylase OafA/YrhL
LSNQPSPPRAPSRSSSAPLQRLRSLDGLRGIAAIVVVAYHSLLISPTLSEIVVNNQPAEPGSFWDLLLHTPLRIFIAGNESVIVFFVLSGLVLTLQVRREREFNWGTYFPRRLVRLYLPMLASIVFAVIVTLLLHRDREASDSAWVQFYTYPEFDWKFAIQAADVFNGTPDFNSPLWSLRWEVLFSLLLPVFVLIASRGRKLAWAAIALAPLAVLVGYEYSVLPLVYLPAFIVGIALAKLFSLRDDSADATELAQPVAPWWGHLVWLVVTIASLFLLILHWLLQPGIGQNTHVAFASSALIVIGAAGIVTVAARWTPAVRVLSLPPIHWLGRISFSLYLVHAPILIATANVAHALPWPVQTIIGVAISFGVAELFTRFVDVPSHRLSKKIGRPAPAAAPRN